MIAFLLKSIHVMTYFSHVSDAKVHTKFLIRKREEERERGREGRKRGGSERGKREEENMDENETRGLLRTKESKWQPCPGSLFGTRSHLRSSRVLISGLRSVLGGWGWVVLYFI